MSRGLVMMSTTVIAGETLAQLTGTGASSGAAPRWVAFMRIPVPSGTWTSPLQGTQTLGTPEARETILAGKALKADAVQYPDRIAARAMETIMEAISGREVPRVVPVEVGLIDQESLKKEQGAP